MKINLPDYINQRFGRLTIVRYVGIHNRYRSFECLCDCGKIKIVSLAHLRSGDNSSCGCLLVEARNRNIQKAIKAQTKHAMSGSSVHVNWSAMMQRCYNHKRDHYQYYGGKGIGVCEKLRMSPKSLVEAIGDRPEPYCSVDRKDSSVGYSCGSCEECKARGWPMNIRWATPTEQAKNRVNNVWITINGERKTCYDWAKHFGRSFHWVRDHYKADERTN